MEALKTLIKDETTLLFQIELEQESLIKIGAYYKALSENRAEQIEVLKTSLENLKRQIR